MRHKRRPVKSSRHKSVTFIIDSQTSFGNQQLATSSQQHQQQQQQQQQQQHFQTSPNTYVRHNNNSHHLAGSYKLPTNSRAQIDINQKSSNHATTSASSSSTFGGTSLIASPANRNRLGIGNTSHNDRRSIIATNDHQNPHHLMRKQFEHNCRHMSDVMRLAFLENNDISIDDCSNVDFNSLSTASILQRNIQQQLQRERRDQLQLRQQQQQQQQQQMQQQELRQRELLHQQRQQLRLQNQQKFHHQHHYLQNQTQHYEQDLGAEFDNLEDYDISDSSIFATATPNSSVNQQSTLSLNAPKHIQQPSGSGGQSLVSSSSSSSRKRARDPTPHVEFSPHVQVGTIQNYGEGFFCDEPDCGKSFPSLRKLRHHKVVHSDEFPFVCEFKGCAKKFKRKFGIDLHSTTHFDLDPDMYDKTSNNSSLPFFGRRMQYSMCKPCGQKFKTVHEYQYHMLKHGKEPFKCPVKGCGQTFGIWKSFQKHRASHYFNYYCKMDPKCDHHTSNLQLLKLHIYCCHFQRKLPDNATLSSKDPPENDGTREDHIDVVDNEEKSFGECQPVEEEDDDGNRSPTAEVKPEVAPSTPRRDSRLRKNPPRSSTFGHQDYASISNRSSSAKSSPSTPQSKRTRSTLKQQKQQQQQQQQHQQQHQHQQQPMQHTLADSDDTDDYDNDDYGISDSGIFATATPTSSSSHNIVNSTPKEALRATGYNGKRKIKEETPRIVSQSPVKQKVVNYGEGFFCDEPDCGKSFPSLRKLRHHKVVHSDEFPFVCKFKGCTKKFKRKFGIDLHSTTHFDLDQDMYDKTSNNSSLPFFGRRMQYSMCKPCGQKFKTVHEYQYHMLKHGKEPFKCPVKGCGQTFGIWKSFQKHRASHYFNYYCKMDPKCDHHTSNLQLLKLHIYCCHFQRELPDNATLASKDPAENEGSREEDVEVVDNNDDLSLGESQPMEEDTREEESAPTTKVTPKVIPSTPRRDSRLRKNPPRSSTFGHQDYASINNGSSFARSLPSTPQALFDRI